MSISDTNNIKLCRAIEFFHDDNEVVRLTDHIADVTINGNIYSSAGNLLSISSVEETATTTVNTVAISLTLDKSIFSLLLLSEYIDKKINIYLCIMPNDGDIEYTFANPFTLKMYEGKVDKPSIKYDEGMANINIICSNVWADLSKKTGRHFNDNEQQTLYHPTDDGFKYCAQNRRNLVWGN